MEAFCAASWNCQPLFTVMPSALPPLPRWAQSLLRALPLPVCCKPCAALPWRATATQQQQRQQQQPRLLRGCWREPSAAPSSVRPVLGGQAQAEHRADSSGAESEAGASRFLFLRFGQPNKPFHVVVSGRYQSGPCNIHGCKGKALGLPYGTRMAHRIVLGRRCESFTPWC